MKKKYLSLIIPIAFILYNKQYPSPFFSILLQDFYSYSNAVQIHTSYLFNPFISLLIHIVLRTTGLISIAFLFRQVIKPLKLDNDYFVYSLIFILFYINIPYKGYIFIILSLFTSSLTLSTLILNFASLPTYICQIIGQKTYLFSDYQSALLIGGIITIFFIILIFIKKIVYRIKNL